VSWQEREDLREAVGRLRRQVDVLRSERALAYLAGMLLGEVVMAAALIVLAWLCGLL